MEDERARGSFMTFMKLGTHKAAITIVAADGVGNLQGTYGVAHDRKRSSARPVTSVISTGRTDLALMPYSCNLISMTDKKRHHIVALLGCLHRAQCSILHLLDLYGVAAGGAIRGLVVNVRDSCVRGAECDYI